MLMEGRSVFALVRSPADLERACQELGGFLSAVRQRTAPAATPACLLGLWVDARGTVELPAALELGGSADAPRHARIAEATGMSAIWMMYALETSPRAPSRAEVLGGLIRARADDGGGPVPGHFIPVFARDTRAGAVKTEMEELECRHPGRLLAPCYHDPRTGVLDWPRVPAEPLSCRQAASH